MKYPHRAQITSENKIFILIFQTRKTRIFCCISVRLNLIEYFKTIVFLILPHQINVEKVHHPHLHHFYKKSQNRVFTKLTF